MEGIIRTSMVSDRYKRAICWVRRDLRLADHASLCAATRQAQRTAVVFIFDSTILRRLKDKNDRRITFIHESLRELSANIRKHGSELIVRMGDPATEIPAIVKELKADAVFTNRDYEPFAKHRDEIVEQKLRRAGVAFHAFKDHVIFEGDEIKTGAGTPFKVFTPYKRVWSEALAPNMVAPHSPVLSKLMRQSECARVSCAWELHNIGFEKNALWLQTGERAAQARLRAFGAKIANYNERRNFPALSDGTSGLSVHLRFGTLSIREAVRFALKHKSTGASTWLSELVWRDFYQMILDQFPYVVEGAFKREYDRLRWPGSSAHFEAWVKGRTGFPIIDAAMRHFAATGWMHNRLRMVVASFLTKDLLVHWKEGEAYFARYLLDFDLAANNGGWQWAASTGCDAQPYFRIFNPVSQSEKFDPDGAFIRANVPELNGFSKKRIHWPHEAPASEQNIAHCQLGKDYPHPIVEHHRQRLKCLQMFKAARKP